MGGDTLSGTRIPGLWTRIRLGIKRRAAGLEHITTCGQKHNRLRRWLWFVVSFFPFERRLLGRSRSNEVVVRKMWPNIPAAGKTAIVLLSQSGFFSTARLNWSVEMASI